MLLQYFSKVSSHIFGEGYNVDIASVQASKVFYIMAGILLDIEKPLVIKDFTPYINESLNGTDYRSLNYMKKRDIEAFAYLFEGVKLLSSLTVKNVPTLSS